MELENIHLQETNYGKGFKGSLYDLLSDVFMAGQSNPEKDFAVNEYSQRSDNQTAPLKSHEFTPICSRSG